MSVLGVDEHHIYGLPDGALADHEQAGLAWAGRLLDVVRPDTVLTFGPDGITFHPDHIAVHRWVTQAWADRGCAHGSCTPRPRRSTSPSSGSSTSSGTCT